MVRQLVLLAACQLLLQALAPLPLHAVPRCASTLWRPLSGSRLRTCLLWARRCRWRAPCWSCCPPWAPTRWWHTARCACWPPQVRRALPCLLLPAMQPSSCRMPICLPLAFLAVLSDAALLRIERPMRASYSRRTGAPGTATRCGCPARCGHRGRSAQRCSRRCCCCTGCAVGGQQVRLHASQQ